MNARSWAEFHDSVNDHPLDLYYVTYDNDPERWEHCRVCDRVAPDITLINIHVTDNTVTKTETR